MANKPTGMPGNGYVEVFCRYIVKNGKRIYPKAASCFHFFVKTKK